MVAIYGMNLQRDLWNYVGMHLCQWNKTRNHETRRCWYAFVPLAYFCDFSMGRWRIYICKNFSMICFHMEFIYDLGSLWHLGICARNAYMYVVPLFCCMRCCLPKLQFHLVLTRCTMYRCTIYEWGCLMFK